ncbi:MAG: GTP-binding protein [Candidatus Heimdallarchaeota archaeon]|nr:GTP-binding protein [Candidatus Heimdallarchaeota archaeon]
MSGYEYTFKLLILGDAAVGKTSLVRRFVHGKFEGKYLMTIGMEPYSRYSEINNTKVVYSIFDIAGEEKFKVMRKMFFQGAVATIIVFDLTRRSSFENAKNWYKEAITETPDQLTILIGNKSDLPDEREVTKEEGETLSNELGSLFYIEASALSGDNVNTAFDKLGENLIKKASSEEFA